MTARVHVEHLRSLVSAAVVLVAIAVVASSAQRSDSAEAQAADSRPNLVFVLLDDASAFDIQRAPTLHNLLRARSTTFSRAFVTTPLCCPARASFLRGQYVHNHGVATHIGPNSGYQQFAALGLNDSTVATWLHDAGYRTAMIGKFLNGYWGPAIPPGWDEWYSIGKTASIAENGTRLEHDPKSVFVDDMVTDVAGDFIVRASAEPKPFFMWIGMHSPHQPQPIAQARHRGKFAHESLPATPAVDEVDVSDKPAYIRARPRMDAGMQRRWTSLHRDRLESLLGVEDNLRELISTLKRTGELSNTYFIVTSDNGFHIGEHRLPPGKMTAYEVDIRVPLYVSGPGVPAGVEIPHVTINTDFAPTLAELGGAQADDFVDGRSFTPLLRSNQSGIAPAQWRHRFLVENLDRKLPGGRIHPAPVHHAVRTRTELYTVYETGEREYYSVSRDPHQVRSRHASMSSTTRTRLERALGALKSCAADACRRAEGGGS